jgi:hypothetical protein
MRTQLSCTYSGKPKQDLSGRREIKPWATGKPRERRQNLAQREKALGGRYPARIPASPRRGRHTIPPPDEIEPVCVAPTGIRGQRDILFLNGWGRGLTHGSLWRPLRGLSRLLNLAPMRGPGEGRPGLEKAGTKLLSTMESTSLTKNKAGFRQHCIGYSLPIPDSAVRMAEGFEEVCD